MMAILCVLLLMSLQGESATRGSAPETPKKLRAEQMAALAREITMKAGDTPLQCLPEPIYRFNDPARAFSDGTVWAYCRSGRPEGLLCLSLEGKQGGRFHWLYEFTSLSSVRVRADGPAPLPWVPQQSGLKLTPVPDAPTPGAEPAKRLREMRALAGRFRASEYFEPNPGRKLERYELRLLPTPVMRYKQPAGGVLDGALFFLVYGQNPEVVVLIEASQIEGKARWTYGVQRISAAKTHIRLDGTEIAELPRINDNDLTRPYAGYIRQISESAGRCLCSPMAQPSRLDAPRERN